MKLISYIDQHDIEQHVDVSQFMFTETFPLGAPDEKGVFPIMGTRICLSTKAGGYVVSKEPADIIWERISKALEL
jgi:hypothetical protein